MGNPLGLCYFPLVGSSLKYNVEKKFSPLILYSSGHLTLKCLSYNNTKTKYH